MSIFDKYIWLPSKLVSVSKEDLSSAKIAFAQKSMDKFFKIPFKLAWRKTKSSIKELHFL